ncbi:MAG: DUF222 domain-containing protein [bacterium]
MADGWADETPEGGHPWVGLAPGAGLAVAVASVDADALPGEARVSLLKARAALQGWVSVRSAEATVVVADAVEHATAGLVRPGDTGRESWVAEEIAAALRVAPATASHRVHDSRALVRRWPAIAEAIREGRLTWSQGLVLQEGIAVLDGIPDPYPPEDGQPTGDASDRALDRVLHSAGRYPPARLRERVRAAVIAVDPDSAERRRRAARRDADVRLFAEEDGMASVWARACAPDAIAVRNAICDRARAMQQGAGDDVERTAGQWRIAALMHAFGLVPVGDPTSVDTSSEPGADDAAASASGDGLSDDPAPVSTPVGVEVRVVVDLATLMGLADHPAHLEGYGPLDPELARALAEDAEWVRWVTDPVGGFLLDEGRRRFPGARLARFIRSRESRCSHPVCGVRGNRLDADHVPEYHLGGTTTASTLTVTCPKHNRRRAAAGWTTHADGMADPFSGPDPTWVSPLGQSYRVLADAILPMSPGPIPPEPDDLDIDPPPF